MIETILWFVACLLSTSGITYLFLKLSDFKLKLSFLFFVFFVVGWIFISLLMIYDISLIRVVFFFVFYPVFFYFLNPIMSFRKVIYYVIVIWFYGVIVDFLIMFLLAFISHFFNIDIYNELFGSIPTMIASLAFVLLGNLKWLNKFTNKIIDVLFKIKYSDFLLVGFTIFTFSIGAVIILNIHDINFESLLILICFLIMITFILMIDKKITEEENSIFLNFLKENNNYYIKMDEENNILKHNLIAKLLSIKSVSNKKSRLLIDDMIKNFVSNIDFLNHVKEIPYGVNGIIYEKISSYSEIIDIKISNEIKNDIFSMLSPRKYNVLIEKFSILLDNAIESSCKSVEKILIINLFENNQEIYIDIKNSFSNTIDLDSIGVKNYTTKAKGHGLGIFSVLRNSEVLVHFKIIDDIFVSRLRVKKKL